jgi:hypothetical protein
MTARYSITEQNVISLLSKFREGNYIAQNIITLQANDSCFIDVS